MERPETSKIPVVELWGPQTPSSPAAPPRFFSLLPTIPLELRHFGERPKGGVGPIELIGDR